MESRVVVGVLVQICAQNGVVAALNRTSVVQTLHVRRAANGLFTMQVMTISVALQPPRRQRPHNRRPLDRPSLPHLCRHICWRPVHLGNYGASLLVQQPRHYHLPYGHLGTSCFF